MFLDVQTWILFIIESECQTVWIQDQALRFVGPGLGPYCLYTSSGPLHPHFVKELCEGTVKLLYNFGFGPDIYTNEKLPVMVPGCLCIVGEPAKNPQPSYAIVTFSDWLQCGGALVSRDLVATTASCVVRPFGQTSLFSVTLGAVDRSKPEATQQHFDVTDIIVHPDYVKNIVADGSSDLALLRLDRNATIIPGVVEVARISSSQGEENLWDKGNVNCSINGYGLMYYGDSGMYSDVRRSIDVSGSTVKDCKETIFPTTFKLSMKKQTCSRAVWTTTCVGDEGSPLICPDAEGRAVLIGLVQYSTCRMSSVIMYTRLFHFRAWIQNKSFLT